MDHCTSYMGPIMSFNNQKGIFFCSRGQLFFPLSLFFFHSLAATLSSSLLVWKEVIYTIYSLEKKKPIDEFFISYVLLLHMLFCDFSCEYSSLLHLGHSWQWWRKVADKGILLFISLDERVSPGGKRSAFLLNRGNADLVLLFLRRKDPKMKHCQMCRFHLPGENRVICIV